MAKLYFNTTAFVLEAHQKAGQTRATRSIDNAIRQAVVRRRPVDERLIIETCMGGQFLIETRAGRDAFSQAFLKHIEQVNSRHGLDGLFLTVLSHLEHTQSPDLRRALSLWSNTPSTARDGEVAFDSRTGIVCALRKSAFDSKRNPFKGQGLELPAFQQKMTALAGGEVMDISCQQWVTAASTILGAAAGVFGGGVIGGLSTGGSGAGVIGGAIGGGLAGASAGKDIGDAEGPIICGWGEADSSDKQETPGEGGFKDDSSIFGDNTSQDNSSQPTPTDGQPTDDDGGENGGWPAPDAYPNPDDTGGNPWSVVELTSFVTLNEATRLMTPVQGGGFSIKALASINTGARALTPSLSLIQHLNLAITGKNMLSRASLEALTVDLQKNGIEAKKVILR